MELMGALSAEDILRSLPDWKTTAEEYHPTPGAIWSLKGLVKDAVVEIYLGTWCPRQQNTDRKVF